MSEAVLERTIAHLRERGIVLPTFAQLADPRELAPPTVDRDAPAADNLFRVHWHNARSEPGFVDVPEHVILGEELTGVPATIVALLGNRFPMIHAHKVLAAYACLAPRLVAGELDPTSQRAIWPSTGNYCRGGVAISRILGCRGVAVLPEGMSAERFRWLDEWVEHPDDVVRTPGTESNVKEIYDECARLAQDPRNVVLNQFAEIGNHVAHHACTGRAAERVFESLGRGRLAAFVSATGSAGTLGAGDYLKERHGAQVVAVEALECPTLLYNGYGEHNIQGIGDKHVPYIHNVTNTDVVVGVSDRSTDSLNVLFSTDAGRAWLADAQGLDAGPLADFGLSSLCNVVAAIKLAKAQGLEHDDVVVTVATDGAEMYVSEVERALGTRFDGRFDADTAARTFDEHLRGADTDHLLELGARDRDRIFNLGYFTWVEQQGVPLEEFEARRSQDWWREQREQRAGWDRGIEAVNAATGITR